VLWGILNRLLGTKLPVITVSRSTAAYRERQASVVADPKPSFDFPENIRMVLQKAMKT
jgi:hypothetical protein